MHEGNDLYHEMIETGVINLEGDSKVAFIFGQMNEPPRARARVALTGLTIAEYFRIIAFHVARQRRALPRARHVHLPFIHVDAASHCARDPRVGSAVRAP